MIYQIIAICDRAAVVYGVPSFVASVGGAIRGFADEVNRKDDNNMFYKHPEDFDMYHVGTYDDSNCSFSLLEEPRQIARGKDLVRS